MRTAATLALALLLLAAAPALPEPRPLPAPAGAAQSGTIAAPPPAACRAEAVLDAAGEPMADLGFCGVGEDEAAAHGLKPGLYLLDAAGRVAAFAPVPDAHTCSEVRLSPGGRVLAVDTGTWVVRGWAFYAYPDLKPLGEVAYYQGDEDPALLWDGDEAALFTGIETGPHGRRCGYDPCGPVSVRAYCFRTRKQDAVFRGTDRCNYTLADFTPATGVVEADRVCLPSAKAWRNYPEDAPLTRVSVKLRRP